MVQKHAATHLHYDFRIELDGVLKSWAVPKGPSMDPSVKRLAMQVEDHPLEYASFEGTIPKGNYGAGEVEIWDNGTYSVPGKSKEEKENLIRKELLEGNLKISLFGKKLKGEFVLDKLKNDPKGNQWLLIKKKDQLNEALTVLEETDTSIDLESLPQVPMPHHLLPMLAFSVTEPFNDPHWIFENKWDGYRAIAEVSTNHIDLYSRNLISFKEHFPTIVSGLKRLKEEMILDGEIVMLDKEGYSQFQLLQNYLNSKETEGFLKYCVFDLLFYKGHDLRELPLLQRKEFLKQILKKIEPSILLFSDHIHEKGIAFFQLAKKMNLEGIIAKEASSPYLSKRSKLWLKIKTSQRQEVVIAGFTQPKGSRNKFGSLIVGLYQKNDLVFVGHVGGGFNEKSLKEIYEKLLPLITPHCPFKKKPKTNTPVTWVEPQLICEVRFQQFTKEGIMRQPIFQGIRIDKEGKEVRKEQPLDTPVLLNSSTSTTSKKLAKNSLVEEFISNPDKVFWPIQGFTKGDLLKYYQEVSSILIPHLKKRPITMFRFPEGITKEGFFQKDAPDFIPKWIETVTIQQSDKNISYILISTQKSLLYVVNLGSIELHPFLSQVPHLNYPDFLVLDIDPVDLPFETTIEVAKEIYKMFEKLNVQILCKTSGKRGLHLYLFLDAKYEYEIVENLAKLLAQYIHERIPDMTSLIRDPKKRKKKVYIDYLQNGPSKSVVAPYSVRAVEGATVSTPLEWKEVKKGLDPHDFTIKTVPPRIKKKGDLFKFSKPVNIQTLIKKIEMK